MSDDPAETETHTNGPSRWSTRINDLDIDNMLKQTTQKFNLGSGETLQLYIP